MTREYIIIFCFWILSFFVGFINRVGSVLSYLWLILYVLYIIVATATTALLIFKDLRGGFNQNSADDWVRISSNLLIVGVFVVAPGIAKSLGYQVMKLWKRAGS